MNQRTFRADALATFPNALAPLFRNGQKERFTRAFERFEAIAAEAKTRIPSGPSHVGAGVFSIISFLENADLLLSVKRSRIHELFHILSGHRAQKARVLEEARKGTYDLLLRMRFSLACIPAPSEQHLPARKYGANESILASSTVCPPLGLFLDGIGITKTDFANDLDVLREALLSKPPFAMRTDIETITRAIMRSAGEYVDQVISAEIERARLST
ncbi:hypothetical protein HY988_02860 [Candidatus Micrarchaeota archaeon]|nr:hypothetical protein [Candidatus Micrarchaeota archaeon]